MQPEILELTGFTGIQSGLGKETLRLDLRDIPSTAKLVAFTGPNGIGKSTIMDNLQPYRTMPSRSTTLGPGGFSYWDNICAPTAKKELHWSHNSERFRSTLVFKVSGRTKKAEAYLARWSALSDEWAPVALPDGTLSDGKSETYDRCIESILGAPESFFTSNFSAQNRKPISAYSAGDIKILMASILDLGYYRELAAKANTVSKFLQFELDGLQGELARLRAVDELIEQSRVSLGSIDEQIERHLASENTATVNLDDSRQSLSLLEAKRDSLAKELEEAAFLKAGIAKANADADQFAQKVKVQSAGDQKRIGNDKTTVENDIRDKTVIVTKVEAEMKRLTTILERESEIKSSIEAIAKFQQDLREIEVDDNKRREEIAVLKPLRTTLTDLSRSAGQVSTSGAAKKKEVDELAVTASLIDEVPCKGHHFQSTCPLLTKAVQARDRIPGHEAALIDMRKDYKNISAEVAETQTKLQKLDVLESEMDKSTNSRKEIETRIDGLNKLANLYPLIDDAKQRFPDLTQNLGEAQEKLIALSSKLSQLNIDIKAVVAIEQAALVDIHSRKESEILVLEERMKRLSKPITDQEIAAARHDVQGKIKDIERIRTTTQQCRDQKVTVSAKIETLRSTKHEAEKSHAKAEYLADEIAKWKLIEKGFGNNGLIALSIDDAGPEISSLCNGLLQECYGGRFSVRLDTQSETAAGNLRETFDVRVSDNHRGEEKSLFIMSGGERVWVNECLARAMSLYIDISKGSAEQTLFSDEADGPLDPDRKRQFMQMKRAVLSKGNYSREYFITQTPELWEEADHIIDVAAL